MWWRITTTGRGTGCTEADWQTEQVSQWQTLFDETYRATLARTDPTFDISGWNSSYTGVPIPEAEMREWVDRTVDAHPRAAPAPRAGDRLRHRSAAVRGWLPSAPPTGAPISRGGAGPLRAAGGGAGGTAAGEAVQRPADDFAGIAAGAFDVVVLNSVVQYFPDVDYLVRVLEGALRAVRPGGRYSSAMCAACRCWRRSMPRCSCTRRRRADQRRSSGSGCAGAWPRRRSW